MRRGIIHFITPETRRKLFEIVYNAYWIKAREEKPKGKGGKPVVNKAMAEDLGVSPQTVKMWKAGRSHGSDECVLKLLKKALELRPRETLQVLREDLERHRALVEAIEAEAESPERDEKGEKLIETIERQTKEIIAHKRRMSSLLRSLRRR